MHLCDASTAQRTGVSTLHAPPPNTGRRLVNPGIGENRAKKPGLRRKRAPLPPLGPFNPSAALGCTEHSRTMAGDTGKLSGVQVSALGQRVCAETLPMNHAPCRDRFPGVANLG